MKTKTLLVSMLLFAAITIKAHSFGLGLQANLSAGDFFAPGMALSICPSRLTHMALNWYFDTDNDEAIIGFTIDAVPLRLPIAFFGIGSLKFTLGVGAFANIFTGDAREETFNIGLRIPVGFSLLLAREILEFYFHVAPSFGVYFIPQLEFSNPVYIVALGARIWLL